MPGKPSISARRWIKWYPSTNPSESTDTLVLTSSSGHFVDIRTLLGRNVVGAAAAENTINAAASSDPTATIDVLGDSIRLEEPKPADQVPPHDAKGQDELVLTPDRLDWAFAGTVERSLDPAVGGGSKGRSVWHHTIDSRYEKADGVWDEGEMFEYEGDEALELEKGEMLNPATGMVQMYEELWAEVPAERVGAEGERFCVVMRTSEDGEGMIVRVGQFCQGILRCGTDLAVERWKWDGDRVDSAMWKRDVRIGTGILPCNATFDTAQVADGRLFVVGGREWRVEEVVKW